MPIPFYMPLTTVSIKPRTPLPSPAPRNPVPVLLTLETATGGQLRLKLEDSVSRLPYLTLGLTEGELGRALTEYRRCGKGTTLATLSP